MWQGEAGGGVGFCEEDQFESRLTGPGCLVSINNCGGEGMMPEDATESPNCNSEQHSSWVHMPGLHWQSLNGKLKNQSL